MQAFLDAATQVDAMLDTKLASVQMLSDMSLSRTVLPAGAINHARHLNARVHPNQGKIVVLGASEIATQTVNLVRPFMPNIFRRLVMVDSLEQAHHLLGLSQPEEI